MKEIYIKIKPDFSEFERKAKEALSKFVFSPTQTQQIKESKETIDTYTLAVSGLAKQFEKLDAEFLGAATTIYRQSLAMNELNDETIQQISNILNLRNAAEEQIKALQEVRMRLAEGKATTEEFFESLRLATIATTRFSDETRRVLGPLDLAHASMTRARMAGLQLVQILQDLPYGFLGVANNIEAFSVSVAYARREGLKFNELLRETFKQLLSIRGLLIPFLVALSAAVLLNFDKITGAVRSFLLTLSGVPKSVRELFDEINKVKVDVFESRFRQLTDSVAETERRLSQLVDKIRTTLTIIGTPTGAPPAFAIEQNVLRNQIDELEKELVDLSAEFIKNNELLKQWIASVKAGADVAEVLVDRVDDISIELPKTLKELIVNYENILSAISTLLEKDFIKGEDRTALATIRGQLLLLGELRSAIIELEERISRFSQSIQVSFDDTPLSRYAERLFEIARKTEELTVLKEKQFVASKALQKQIRELENELGGLRLSFEDVLGALGKYSAEWIKLSKLDARLSAISALGVESRSLQEAIKLRQQQNELLREQIRLELELMATQRGTFRERVLKDELSRIRLMQEMLSRTPQLREIEFQLIERRELLTEEEINRLIEEYKTVVRNVLVQIDVGFTPEQIDRFVEESVARFADTLTEKTTAIRRRMLMSVEEIQRDIIRVAFSEVGLSEVRQIFDRIEDEILRFEEELRDPTRREEILEAYRVALGLDEATEESIRSELQNRARELTAAFFEARAAAIEAAILERQIEAPRPFLSLDFTEFRRLELQRKQLELAIENIDRAISQLSLTLATSDDATRRHVQSIIESLQQLREQYRKTAEEIDNISNSINASIARNTEVVAELSEKLRFNVISPLSDIFGAIGTLTQQSIEERVKALREQGLTEAEITEQIKAEFGKRIQIYKNGMRALIWIEGLGELAAITAQVARTVPFPLSIAVIALQTAAAYARIRQRLAALERVGQFSVSSGRGSSIDFGRFVQQNIALSPNITVKTDNALLQEVKALRKDVQEGFRIDESTATKVVERGLENLVAYRSL